MYKFCTLYSGSSGNSTYIGSNTEGVLIDIGKNAKQTCLALESMGIDPTAVKAVFVTHEHIDHVCGIRVFCKKLGIPVFATGGTLDAMDRGGHLDGDFPVFQITDYADVGDFHINMFHTSHDTAESCGYSIILPNGIKTAVATDLGIVTEEVEEGILGSKVALIESNHDVSMLENGPYPYYLKRRILSERGHLCNESCADTVLKLIQSGAEQIYLGHLSAENNTPDVAFQTTCSRLNMAGIELGSDYALTVASRHEACGGEI